MTDFVYEAKVLSQTVGEQQVDLKLHVPANLYYFQGHFSSAPILAGVVQTHWVMQYLAEFFAVDINDFEGFSNLKFQIIVQPEYTLDLTIKRIKANKFSFSYQSEHGQHASGKVQFSQ
ncbi:hypothetical protein DS2_07288 [Catenovulum agarivorans DS-2]|uniref:ApeI dehydratase-like domain-containing protein n=1 Tax=Catenovulum agarivorans DS-2 TaxID=1328313 RepID=W7QNT4_9ALTE|nr:acyl-CoA synthetase [Catenovulum agarivorans]EWH10617.1 hypothetical protein DS2_07288 [Catenovulum agarivorans DS-2]